jgi:two-component system, OmpR family, response regulator ResD
MSSSAQPSRSEQPRGAVLVVDDEPTIAEIVARYLERAGYETRTANDGPRAVSVASSWRPDLIVLDVMLPGFDGYEVMRRLRAQEPANDDREGLPAVILLTARGEEAERIAGLRRGADDYVVKPFSPAEIVARTDTVLRRVAPRARSAAASERIEADGLVIDPLSRTVEVDGCEVALTTREFELLRYLAANPGRVFSRGQLMETVWTAPFFTDTSTVTVHVRRLRAKIERDPTRPRYIETARGAGYRFRRSPRAGSSTDRR